MAHCALRRTINSSLSICMAIWDHFSTLIFCVRVLPVIWLDHVFSGFQLQVIWMQPCKCMQQLQRLDQGIRFPHTKVPSAKTTPSCLTSLWSSCSHTAPLIHLLSVEWPSAERKILTNILDILNRGGGRNTRDDHMTIAVRKYYTVKKKIGGRKVISVAVWVHWGGNPPPVAMVTSLSSQGFQQNMNLDANVNFMFVPKRGGTLAIFMSIAIDNHEYS